MISSVSSFLDTETIPSTVATELTPIERSESSEIVCSSDFVSSVCSSMTSVSSPGGGLTRPEAIIAGGSTKLVSVVSLPFGFQGVLFSNLCNAVFHLLQDMTLPLQSLYLAIFLYAMQCRLHSLILRAYETKQFLHIHTVLPDSLFSIF